MTQKQINEVTTSSPGRWRALAENVLQGRALDESTGMAILQADDGELLDLLAAAYRVRRHWFGNRMHLNFLINAKSGQCGENCGYCSQSSVSRATIDRYSLLSADEMLDGAEIAVRNQAKTYCMVTSGRRPTEAEFALIEQVAPKIKAAHPLKLCFSPGMLDQQQAERLKRCGIDRINHNLNTSEAFYP
ncbi:MAG: radical SAM protein, partial [Pirellulaceae bacterium]|nr:radical SAM protein [Pirellulaceae bacterium]